MRVWFGPRRLAIIPLAAGNKISLHSVCVVCMYLVDVLALKLAKQRFETLVISFDADCAEDALDVFGGWRGVAAEGEQEIGC